MTWWIRFCRWFDWHFGGLAQERIDSAWERIEGLERANGELRNQINELRSVVMGTVSEFNDRLTRLQEAPKPTPTDKPIRTARNWREFADAASVSTTVKHKRSS